MIYVPVLSVFFLGVAVGVAAAGLMFRRTLRRYRAAFAGFERLMADHKKATESQIQLLRNAALARGGRANRAT